VTTLTWVYLVVPFTIFTKREKPTMIQFLWSQNMKPRDTLACGSMRSQYDENFQTEEILRKDWDSYSTAKE
jgi:hypothetical protein